MGPLPSLLKLYHRGQKWPRPGVICFTKAYIGKHNAIEKLFLSETTMPRALIFGMKHHLVNLCQVCTNFISGAKNYPTPGGHMFYIGLYREKHGTLFLSEIIRLRALIFGM